MAHSLPLTKFAGLIIKTLSKPLSKRIKHEFSRYQVTQRLLIGIGETSHQVSSRMTIWSAGYRVRNVKPLEEEKALKQGAEFVGESVIFLISGGWIWYEYDKSQTSAKEKAAASKAAALKERQEIMAQVQALSNRLGTVEEALETTQESLQKLASLHLYDYSAIQQRQRQQQVATTTADNNAISSNVPGDEQSRQQERGANVDDNSNAQRRPWWRPW